MRYLLCLLLAVGLVSCGGSSEAPPPPQPEEPAARTPSPEGAEVFFITPHDGDTVASPFVVEFGLKNMGVAPAGVDVPGTGHHHLLVDVSTLPPMDQPLGSKAMHFGGGQTQTSLSLSPGQHTLQLIMGDSHHIPLDPPVISDKITVTVK